MVFLKEFLEKVDFEKNQQSTKKHGRLPSIQSVEEGINGGQKVPLAEIEQEAHLCAICC